MTEAREITDALGGHWFGHYGIAPCPVCQPERRKDQRALTLSDGHRGLLLDCKKAGCRFIDILRAAGVSGRSCRTAGPRQDQDRASQGTSMADHARNLWRAAEPIEGSPAELYLCCQRRIDGPLLGSLRYAPRTWHGPTRRNLPAMVALIEGGHTFAVSRTFLRPDGSDKAALPKHQQKMMLGRAAGGHVALASGSGSLVIAEGVETALSMPLLLGDRSLTVWAALTAANMGSVALPDAPDHLVIAMDGDAAGRDAGSALATRARELGWSVECMTAPDGQDWNDVLVSRETV